MLKNLLSELRGAAGLDTLEEAESIEELKGIPTKDPSIRDYANAIAASTMGLEREVKKVGNFSQAMFEKGTHPDLLEKEYGDFAPIAREYVEGALAAARVAHKALGAAGAALAFIIKRRDNPILRKMLKDWKKVVQQMHVEM